MYQLINDPITRKLANTVKRLTDNAFIPFAVDNTDYQTFKSDLTEGVELQDPDGNVMTQPEVDAFLETIP